MVPFSLAVSRKLFFLQLVLVPVCACLDKLVEWRHLCHSWSHHFVTEFKTISVPEFDFIVECI